MLPKRIQRKRTKGFRLPPNTICVTRPGNWGNEFTVAEYGERLALLNYRGRWQGILLVNPRALDELRNADFIACWCRTDAPCHGDILIDLMRMQDVAEREDIHVAAVDFKYDQQEAEQPSTLK